MAATCDKCGKEIKKYDRVYVCDRCGARFCKYCGTHRGSCKKCSSGKLDEREMR